MNSFFLIWFKEIKIRAIQETHKDSNQLLGIKVQLLAIHEEVQKGKNVLKSATVTFCPCSEISHQCQVEQPIYLLKRNKRENFN